MYVVRRGNEYLVEYETGGYYWSGPALSDVRKTWAARFSQADAEKVARQFGGVAEPL